MGETWSRRQVIALAPVGIGILVVRVLVRPGSTPEASPSSSPVATPGASPVATPMEAGRPVSVADKVTIRLTDSGFRPDYVQATNGHDLHVTLRNTGSREHDFKIKDLDVDETLAPGEETRLTIESPPLGDFTFTSDAPGDEGFEGTLVFYI